MIHSTPPRASGAYIHATRAGDCSTETSSAFPFVCFVRSICSVTTTHMSPSSKPNYSYLRKLFRDLFVHEGYQYDYTTDLTGPFERTRKRMLPPAMALILTIPHEAIPLTTTSMMHRRHHIRPHTKSQGLRRHVADSKVGESIRPPISFSDVVPSPAACTHVIGSSDTAEGGWEMVSRDYGLWRGTVVRRGEGWGGSRHQNSPPGLRRA